MPRKEILDQIQKYIHPFRIRNGKGFRLNDFDPGDVALASDGEVEAVEPALEELRHELVAPHPESELEARQPWDASPQASEAAWLDTYDGPTPC